jgi:hypothetical protein
MNRLDETNAKVNLGVVAKTGTFFRMLLRSILWAAPVLRLLPICCGVLPGPVKAHAATVVQTFDDFNLSGTYQRWADANFTTITSGPESYTVASAGFGGGFFDLNPPVDASGETAIALDVTVAAAGTLPGVVLALVDLDGTLENYAWFALADGRQVLTKTIGMTSFGGEPGSVPGLDVSKLDFFHIQVDGQQPYTVSYNNLELTHPVPEPGACALLALGGMLVVRRRKAEPRSLTSFPALNRPELRSGMTARLRQFARDQFVDQ